MFAKINLRLFVGMWFLFFVMSASTFGQGLMIYSDTWADTETGAIADSDGEISELYIVGGGVVEIAADMYHTVDMQVTLTSPEGRTAYASGIWTQESKGTSLTVLAPISMRATPEPPDVGNYQTNLVALPTCPDSHTPWNGGSSGTFGASIITMQFVRRQGQTWVYQIVPNCNVLCRIEGLFHRRNGGPFIRRMTFWGPFGCLAGGVVFDWQGNLPCADLSSPI